jgi:uncharacterized protein with PIN domain
MSDDPNQKEFQYATKRCPYCYEYMPLRTTRCPGCNKSVGEVERHGMAKKTVDLKAYMVAFLAIIALSAYIWWAFL